MRRLALATLLGFASFGASTPDLGRGDAAWDARAEGAVEDRPQPEPVFASIRAYESVVEAHPDALEARWKLLRSLHFAGTFVLRDEDARRREIFGRATEIAEAGLDRLAQQLGGGGRPDELAPGELAARLEAGGVAPRDVARLYFWSAIAWGSWSSEEGLLAVVRKGVAGRLHRHGELSLALEPTYEEGGAYRLLGRLHATLPRVPFLSGWVDRDRAIPLLERANALAPEHPGNPLLLAITLLDLAPERRGEALALLQRAATLSPRPSTTIEDLTLIDEANQRLARIQTGSG